MKTQLGGQAAPGAGGASNLVRGAIQSTSDYLQYLRQQQLGRERHRVRRESGVRAEERFVLGKWLYLYTFSASTQLRLTVESEVEYLPQEGPPPVRVVIADYDRKSGRLVLGFEGEQSSVGGSLIVDLTWLVERVLNWLQTRGASVRALGELLPANGWQDVCSWIQATRIFGDGSPGQGQIDAIASALQHPVTYTWGPPGSGKTDYILAGVALFLASGGKRVLVAGPTNQAVDNALRAIVKRARLIGYDIRQILRLGQPTPEFVRDHPDLCEDGAVREELTAIEAERATLSRRRGDLEKCVGVEQEREEGARRRDSLAREIQQVEMDARRKSTRLQQACREITELEQRRLKMEHEVNLAREERQRLGWWAWVRPRRRAELDASLEERTTVLSSLEIRLRQLQRDIVDLEAEQREAEQRAEKLRCPLEDEERRLQNLDRQAGHLRAQAGLAESPPAEGWLAHLRTLLKKDGARLQELQDLRKQVELNYESRAILGLTLDAFIGQSAQRGFRMDHVLLDEAAYAHLAKTIPLLSLGCPLAFFGDHRQLPPVCEADDSDARSGAYWGRSSLYLEAATQKPLDFQWLWNLKDPPHKSIVRSSLLESFRFGPELAGVLDRFVYRFGLQGRAPRGTEVVTVEVAGRKPQVGVSRVNIAEVEKVIDILEVLAGNGVLGNVAVLTPYKNQAVAIRKELRRRPPALDAEVLNTHKSQGREWDIVIFSAVDGKLPECAPWFTDSQKEKGLQLLNTTLSRVRRRLYLVVESGFWMSKRDQLLGELVRMGLAGPDGWRGLPAPEA